MKDLQLLKKHIKNQHNIDNLDDYFNGNGVERILYEEIELKLKNKRKINSPFCLEFYISRGYSEDEAKEKIDEYRQKHKDTYIHPSKPEYYINKGFSKEESIIKSMEFLERSGLSNNQKKARFIKQYGKEIGIQIYKEHKQKLKNRTKVYANKFETREDSIIMVTFLKSTYKKHHKIDYNNYKKYKHICELLTRLSIRLYRSEIDPSGEKLGEKYGINGYSLDHKYSIYGGFVNKIHPFKISSKHNLELIPVLDNSSKGSYCSISIDELNSYDTILDDKNISEEIKEKIKDVYYE